jgi:hypothetical protein
MKCQQNTEGSYNCEMTLRGDESEYNGDGDEKVMMTWPTLDDTNVVKGMCAGFSSSARANEKLSASQ